VYPPSLKASADYVFLSLTLYRQESHKKTQTLSSSGRGLSNKLKAWAKANGHWQNIKF